MGSGQELGLSSEVAAEPVTGMRAGVELELGLNLGSGLGLRICSPSGARVPPRPTETGTMLWRCSDATLFTREHRWAVPSALLPGQRLCSRAIPSRLENPLRRSSSGRGSEPRKRGAEGRSSAFCPRRARETLRGRLLLAEGTQELARVMHLHGQRGSLQRDRGHSGHALSCGDERDTGGAVLTWRKEWRNIRSSRKAASPRPIQSKQRQRMPWRITFSGERSHRNEDLGRLRGTPSSAPAGSPPRRPLLAPLGAHLGSGSVGCLLGSSRPFPTGRSSASCAVSSSRLSCSFPCEAQGGGWGAGPVPCPCCPPAPDPDVPNLQRAAGRCPPAWCRATSPAPSACGTGSEGMAPAPGSGTRPGRTRTGPAAWPSTGGRCGPAAAAG